MSFCRLSGKKVQIQLRIKCSRKTAVFALQFYCVQYDFVIIVIIANPFNEIRCSPPKTHKQLCISYHAAGGCFFICNKNTHLSLGFTTDNDIRLSYSTRLCFGRYGEFCQSKQHNFKLNTIPCASIYYSPVYQQQLHTHMQFQFEELSQQSVSNKNKTHY